MSVVTFRLFKQRNNEDINTEKKEIVFSKEWKLIGVKIDDLLSKDIVKIKKEYKLDNLYSSQDKIKCLLKNAIYLDITFTDIKFFPELEDESDYKEIRKLLKNKDMEKLLEYIEEIEKREEVDIIGLKFILGKKYEEFQNASISITNSGRFSTNCEIEFKNLFSSEIFGILTGRYELC